MRIIAVILLLIITLTACSFDLTPKALASETQNIVEQIQDSSDDVFADIQYNIDLVNELKVKIQDARLNGEPLPLDTVIKDLKKVTESYERLSGDHESIRQSLLKKIDTIQQMQGSVDTEISLLRDKRVDYSEQLNSVADPDPDIVATRKESLARSIEYVDAQIILWQDFNSIEDNIVSELDNVEQTIDRFLNVIDSSAILFREGLNLLVLQRDINDALSLFTQDLPRMNQLSDDMKSSWDTLDYLVDTLTSVSAEDMLK